MSIFSPERLEMSNDLLHIEIEVANAVPGGGSVFWFTLPVEQSK
jgi:hypothetical protein